MDHPRKNFCLHPWWNEHPLNFQISTKNCTPSTHPLKNIFQLFVTYFICTNIKEPSTIEICMLRYGMSTSRRRKRWSDAKNALLRAFQWIQWSEMKKKALGREKFIFFCIEILMLHHVSCHKERWRWWLLLLLLKAKRKTE